MRRDLTWMDDALCAQTDPELFHPEGSGVGYRAARAVCQACPVRPECTAHAQSFEGTLAHTHRYGLWGAEVPKQRQQSARGEAA